MHGSDLCGDESHVIEHLEERVCVPPHESRHVLTCVQLDRSDADEKLQQV